MKPPPRHVRRRSALLPLRTERGPSDRLRPGPKGTRSCLPGPASWAQSASSRSRMMRSPHGMLRSTLTSQRSTEARVPGVSEESI
jgi:hypothetical protein